MYVKFIIKKYMQENNKGSIKKIINVLNAKFNLFFINFRFIKIIITNIMSKLYIKKSFVGFLPGIIIYFKLIFHFELRK